MGLADRTYMRGEPGSPRVPATHLALGVLIGVFVLQLIQASAHASFLQWMPLERTAGFRPWTWVTYSFLHDTSSIFHLIGNGLTLWFIGPLVEAEHGRSVFWRVLLVGALSGAFIWWLTGIGSGGGEIIGASAALAAMLAFGLSGRQDEQVTILVFFVIPVPMRIRWLMRGLWTFSLCGWLFAELPGDQRWAFWEPVWHSNIAHSAHLGGLIAGTAMVWLARRREARPFSFVTPQTNRAPASAQSMGPASPPANASDARAELDRLLDKISAEGFGSLNAEERSRLESLSSRLR